MLKRKRLREKGKIKISRAFQKLKETDKVSVIREHSLKSNFPKRIQGKVGNVLGKRGKAYIVKIGNKEHIIPGVHLKKMKGGKLK
ncbi:50S ribosomal protein L21e [Candidatus Woesearchaeota archaeon CG10_big_fil_rev_8_21_14_0_10_34_12]|nr:MAG: 50S ribosomal protein L21e [Candidatus Woesearchaeota archaeon CG10_big_fil_rev_8_21_14_0_10_34_12]